MPPVLFKLKYGNSTRRVSFQDQPTWAELAGRLQALYNLPLDTIGVSYVDTDNDEITVSSNEELQDYYSSTLKPGELVKLTVLNLSAAKQAIQPSVNRNTFGEEAFDFLEPDWHRVAPAGLGGLTYQQEVSLDGPHAFVEVVNSDVSTMNQDGDSDSDDDHSTTRAPFLDKGKRKASSISLGAASITSLVAAEASEKFPIHVFDHNSAERPTSAPAERETSASEASFAHSTPKAQAKDVEMTEATDKDPAPSTSTDDPPLPSIDDHPTTNPSPSFASDVSALLTSLSGIIHAHPELAEGVRNIVQGATSGAYWQAHRSAMSEAANGFAQAAADEARNVEADATRRVYDALGNLFQSFSGGVAPTSQPDGSPSEPSTTQNPNNFCQPRRGASYPWGMFGDYQHPHRPPFDFFMHGLPPYHRGFGHPYGPAGSPPHMRHPFPPRMDHPPPPPPPSVPHPPPPPSVPTPPVAPNPAAVDDFHVATPPSVGTFPHNHYHLRHMYGGPHSHRHSLQPRLLPQVAVDPNFSTNVDQPSSPEELRARVEKAKQEYRSQKQAYRREREQRRKTKESPVEAPVTLESLNIPPETTQVVSNAWGSYPQVEMFGVPKRANTMPSRSGPRFLNRSPEDSNTRAINRIAKKMADMGFTENSHPDLLTKIKSNMPATDTITKEQEDDMVTNLLEDLIPSSPLRAPGPVASGSSTLWQ
ncbi:hypothetical protein CPB83DRAFT_842142 [Crepidotus variabilis]|uniref:PB1 domain-containing protein n=1 Tax=Crepidotus variabilis TaxID=179855 RepID=A0A9P6EUE0_9AGAR|nr:hypothetical protein CPB83DRAFT_842142 [Crepidotus variabilis]